MKHPALVRSLALLALLCGAAASAGALDKLTTVAIVDIDKVYLATWEESAAVRDYNKFRASLQEEYKNLGAAIVELNKKKLAAQTAGDSAEVLRIEREILDKSKYFRDYKAVKDKELAAMKESLEKSDAFKQELDNAIEFYAISQGFTIVLTAGEGSNAYWWSTEVDITNKIIEILSKRLK